MTFNSNHDVTSEDKNYFLIFCLLICLDVEVFVFTTYIEQKKTQFLNLVFILKNSGDNLDDDDLLLYNIKFIAVLIIQTLKVFENFYIILFYQTKIGKTFEEKVRRFIREIYDTFYAKNLSGQNAKGSDFYNLVNRILNFTVLEY